MPRYRLTIEYDGTSFAGWQKQPSVASVQAALESAFHKFTGEVVDVRGAGRTDAGVHALGQVAHVDLARVWPSLKIREALNFHLQPHPIAIVTCENAADDFEARFSATSRHYLYRISNRRAPPVLDANRVWHVPYPLDHAAMHLAAQHLVGRHDFSTFRAASCQAASALRTLDGLAVARLGDEVQITAVARSFLHSQVRSMVGSLKRVGEGRWRVDDLAHALAAKNREACGPVAPPEGLYLARVDYGTPSVAMPDEDADGE